MPEFHSSTEYMTDRKYSTRTNRYFILGAIVVGIVTFTIGILIGRFATCPDAEPEEVLPDVSAKLLKDEDPSIGDLLINNMESQRIRENLRYLSEKPHLAGTENNHELGRYLKQTWEENGLDHVTMTPYSVMLSYPNMSDLNYVEILNERDETVYKSNLTEPILTPEEDKPDVVPPFNAYSGAGDVLGDLVYVNYGRVDDYVTLANLTNLNVSGKIVLARYGKIFRGDKVKQAQIRGAKGIILFSDPDDVTAGDINQVYPHDWWLPGSGAQRGTVFIGDGDPLTQDYPAISSAYRKLDDSEFLPDIPSHPIGYDIAINLMRELGGDEVPVEWRGGMNVTYKYGGTFLNIGWKARVKVSTKPKQVMTYNVIGVIKGQVEPDRYVLIGNHRDAWVFGALDPSSGTAVMMEMARVMGKLVKEGRWRPRRTILFCSWGAEEYGLVGSTEWVEHYTKSLGARSVAYLNVDIAVEGNTTLSAYGTPLMFQTVYESAKKVPNPNQTEVASGRRTVYDTWKYTLPAGGKDKPDVQLAGSGSDHAPFRDRLGIPIMGLLYTWEKGASTYPLYHSAYETFYAVDKIMDRGFKYHTAVGQVWVEMARHLADSLILPFDVMDYADVMRELEATFMTQYRNMMEDKGIDTSLLSSAIANFTECATMFKDGIKNIDVTNAFAVRSINDQLMQLDRAFLDPAGLPGRRLKRHILLAESSIDSYAGSSFPGLADALEEIKVHRNVEAQWEIIKKHYSVVLFTIQSAASTLKDVTDFMYDYM